MLFDSLDNIVQRPQFKNNRVAHRLGSIRRSFDVVVFVDHLAFEPQTGCDLAEQQQRAAVCRVSNNSGVAAQHLHVTDLAFAEVLKYAIRSCPVSIAVGEPFLGCNDDHQAVLCWCYDAALLLAPEAGVDILSPVIDATSLKSPVIVALMCTCTVINQ